MRYQIHQINEPTIRSELLLIYIVITTRLFLLIVSLRKQSTANEIERQGLKSNEAIIRASPLVWDQFPCSFFFFFIDNSSL